MIPTYEPSDWLVETLRSVQIAAANARGTFQVEIVDDASPSGTLPSLLKRGGLSVPLYIRPVNGGLATCWNDCITRSRGALIHILHQDDVVLPSFYLEMEKLAAQHPEAGMMFCRAISRTQDATRLGTLEQEQPGILQGWLEKISSGQRLLCPSVVVRRGTYVALGGFDARLKFVIDWEMWVRIAARFEVGYLPEALVEYRVHEKSETARLKSEGCITDDLAVAYDLITSGMHGAKGAGTRRRVLSFLVWCSWDAASSAERAHNPAAARRESLAALRHWLLLMRPKQTLRNVLLFARSFSPGARRGGSCRSSHGTSTAEKAHAPTVNE